MKALNLLIIILIILSSFLCAAFAAEPNESPDVNYISVEADSFIEYNTPKELAESSDAIFEGTLTGIRFEITDIKTGLPLDVTTLPEGTVDIEYGSMEFDASYRLDTVYEISVLKTYKGDIEETVDLYLEWGLKDYEVEEQLKIISDCKFKNPNNYIEFLEIDYHSYGSHINIGKNYIFFGMKNGDAKIRIVDKHFFAFGEDYPKSNANRPLKDFIQRFNYNTLTEYLNGGIRMRGDVNNDDKVDSTDLIIIKRHILCITAISGDNLISADIDNSDKVDSTDYIIVKRIILGL